MSRIHVLDKHTAELIAAGEVVERPASVVKELVENAIDALATSITVEITSGGVSMIRISDNGFGIRREDVPKAFLRHSTSKISSETDLDAIGTLGFRGEALASVAAVSRTEMLTRNEEEETGTRYRIEGGEELYNEEAGCPVGTTITVRDLFYNTPARMKFLKKDVSEANAVAAVLDRIALSHPEISFKLLREGKETLLTPGDCKLLSAVYAVYGKEFASSLIPVTYELGGIAVSGLISKPSFARPNRNMQHFYINDRYVKSRTMMAAIEEAFKGSVMVGKFPACVLSLAVPFDRVDVNVHPAKIEVRFSDERPIFDAVYYAVKSTLSNKDARPSISLRPPAPVFEVLHAEQTAIKPGGLSSAAKDAPAQSVLADHTADDQPLMAADTHFSKFSSSSAANPQAVDDRETAQPPSEIPRANPFFFSDIPAEQSTVPPGKAVSASLSEETAQELSPPCTPCREPDEASLEPDVIPVSARYLGEAFKTYAILEADNGLLFIDKHAAHERILYNQLREGARQEQQMLLAPVTVTLSKEEYGALIESIEMIHDAGFDIEDFGGGCVLVRSVPAMLDGEDVVSLISEIAGGLINNRQSVRLQRLDDLYHSIACRAAVKAGNKSSDAELISLANEIFSSDEIRYCPHGRPVAFLLRRHEIEKQFGRV